MKEPLESVTGAGHRLGEYIRDQRKGSQISLRQLAALAGVSNPYLSQIERGLRRPSAEILQQIAKGLRISAEALYLQAGLLQPDRHGVVADAVLADEGLSERQKQVLLEVYESFRRENGTAATAPAATNPAATAPAATAPAPTGPPQPGPAAPTSPAPTSPAPTSPAPAAPAPASAAKGKPRRAPSSRTPRSTPAPTPPQEAQT